MRTVMDKVSGQGASVMEELEMERVKGSRRASNVSDKVNKTCGTVQICS